MNSPTFPRLIRKINFMGLLNLKGVSSSGIVIRQENILSGTRGLILNDVALAYKNKSIRQQVSVGH